MRRNHFRGLALGFGGSVFVLASWATVASANARTALLASGESETYSGYFLSGEKIYADCDTNCRNLDLYLYDAYTGELVRSDTQGNAKPNVFAPYDGDFQVETVMVTCAASVCEAWTNSEEGF